tara:strand:+ start:1888 stop:2982 length:1095 start_codon:yes stop_codon:yes gene_type:complete
MKFRDLTIIFVCIIFYIFEISPVMGQAGIRAQGRDVNTPGGPNQQSQGQDPNLIKEINHAQEMRKFIIKISRFTRKLNPNFIVIVKDGFGLLEKPNFNDNTTASPAYTYLKSIDGLLISGLNFRPPVPGRDEIKTDNNIKQYLIRLSKLAKKRGISIWVKDYAPNSQIAKDSVTLNNVNNFVTFTAKFDGNIFDRIPDFPVRPINENPHNVDGIKGAKNFLYLTDTSRYEKAQDFMYSMSNTNFDAIVTDVFHKGRAPFNKNIVRGLGFKKVGAKRLVLAQMNIGAADSSSYYWKPGWRQGQPVYINEPTPGNPDKHYVQYWYKAWQDLITSTPKSYVYGIFKQGFDGVVISGVNSYQFFEGSE